MEKKFENKIYFALYISTNKHLFALDPLMLFEILDFKECYSICFM